VTIFRPSQIFISWQDSRHRGMCLVDCVLMAGNVFVQYIFLLLLKGEN
jgi:hypothetical protein